MRHRGLICLFVFFVAALGWSQAGADPHGAQFPQNATFTTKAITPFAIEGLTMDNTGNFYTTGRQTDTTKKCPVWKINPTGTTRVTVGFIPNPAASACNPSGITFDSAGNLYIADAGSGGNIRKVTPDPTGCASDDSSSPLCSSIPDSTDYAINVPGTNGLAFDKFGNLWTGDGTTGLGRVWKITGAGANCLPGSLLNCVEAFRVQPMRNGTALDGLITSTILTGTGAIDTTQGVGRQARTFPHTVTGGNPQDLVANGVAFDKKGNLFIADTARGIWKVEFDKKGNLKNGQTGCDTTFTSNTLCLNRIFAAHPILEGADGIALDVAGNIWVDANERQAVAVVSKEDEDLQQVFEIFRNPVNSTTGIGLRNAGDLNGVGNNHILEFPSSPFLLGNTFCTAQSDGNRRDNFPNTAGEIKPAGPDRGKISCMDQPLNIPGLPLPVQ